MVCYSVVDALVNIFYTFSNAESLHYIFVAHLRFARFCSIKQVAVYWPPMTQCQSVYQNQMFYGRLQFCNFGVEFNGPQTVVSDA